MQSKSSNTEGKKRKRRKREEEESVRLLGWPIFDRCLSPCSLNSFPQLLAFSYASHRPRSAADTPVQASLVNEERRKRLIADERCCFLCPLTHVPTRALLRSDANVFLQLASFFSCDFFASCSALLAHGGRPRALSYQHLQQGGCHPCIVF